MTEIMRFDQKFHRAANRFLLTLGALLHQAQIYEADNKTLKDLFERLARDHKSLYDVEPFFRFRGQDQTIFVNDERLRCDGATFFKHHRFLAELGSRRIGGMALHSLLDVSEWKGVIGRITRSRQDSPTPFQDIRESFQESGLWDKVELLPHLVEVRLANLLNRDENRITAVRAYAKTMAVFRLYIDNMDEAPHLKYYHLKLYRTIQELADVCREGGWKHLGVVNNKSFDEYRYNHPTNVAMLSLIMGCRMKLRRARLAELGMAAIFHDLGKTLVPGRLVDKKGVFTEAERRAFNEHPRFGVKALLRLRQYNESLLKRIMVIHEHHKPIEPGIEHHPYSRIVAVAEQFDAMTSARRYRRPMLPHEAVRQILALAGSRLDRDVAHLFVQTVGYYPPGSLVRLNGGERAVVFEPDPDPRKWEKPVVRVIQDAGGGDCDPIRVLRLGEHPDRFVEEVLLPEDLGINVTGYVYRDVDLESIRERRLA